MPIDEADTGEEGKETEDIWQQETVEEPAGYEIPVDKVAVATIDGDVQKVKISVGKNRFQPAIIVLQRGMETEWTIQIDFDFSTEAQKIFGYVKVVDDMNKVNLKDIRKEVKEHTTYLWNYNLVGSME